MAILKGSIDTAVSNALVSDNGINITSGFGTLKITIELDDDTDDIYNIKLDRLDSTIILPVGTEAELVGKSWAIGTIPQTIAVGALSAAVRTETANLPDADTHIVGGVGKIRYTNPSDANDYIVFGIDDLNLPLTTDTSDWQLEQGAIAFTQAATATVLSMETSASSGDTISAGKGTATLAQVDGNGVVLDSFIIRLNEINYPFDLATGETLTANGNSFFLA